MTFKEYAEKIPNLIVRLEKLKYDQPKPREQVGICTEILRAIVPDLVAFDKYTPQTREGTGRYFEAVVDSELNPNSVWNLFLFLVRCIRERNLRARGPDLGVTNRAIGYYASAPFDGLDSEEKAEWDFLQSGMMKHIVHSFADDIQQWEMRIKDVISVGDRRIAEMEKILREGESKVQRHQHAFNFVGLSSAFKSMAEKKQTDLQVSRTASIAIGVLTVGAPLIAVFNASYGEKKIWNGPSDLFYLIPLVVLEVMLLYHFRIVLKNYYSAKAQLLQLDLRYAVCAFIQSYAEFAKKIEESKLSKFESLIFSNIVTDASQIPSTFDGLEHLGKFIGDLKGKGKE